MRISVGIPSYNEGINLVRLLHSLSNQHLGENKLKEVIVSDDSEDDTPSLIRKLFQNPPYKLTLIHHEHRRGVAEAWNEIFREASGDVVVLYDADVIIEEDTTLNLVKNLRGDIGVAASNTLPLSPKTIAGKASETVARWLRRIRQRHPEAQFTVMGRGVAVRSEITRRVRIPSQTIAVDLYLQCMARKLGWRIVYVDDAHVWFRPAESFRDFASQVIRAYIGHRQLRKLVKELRERIGLREQWSILVEVLSENPWLSAPTIISYTATLFLFPTLLQRAGTHIWEIATTSKNSESNRR